jgi:hypothetical protein
MNVFKSSLYLTGSILSLFNSACTALILLPPGPMIVETGLIPSAVEVTAILAAYPGILAIPLISTIPSAISGTFLFNK